MSNKSNFVNTSTAFSDESSFEAKSISTTKKDGVSRSLIDDINRATVAVNHTHEAIEQQNRIEKPNASFNVDPTKVLRMHYASIIVRDINCLKDRIGDVGSCFFANRLLKNMREMEAHLSSDPYCEIVMAMHDALAYDNRWASYNKEQYSTAHTLFIQLASTSHWDDLKVSKAISTLENAGFDTLPFELDIEETMVENDLGGISSR